MVDFSHQQPYVRSLRAKPYIVGYSGYIPGMSFCYGQTFGKAAEDCIAAFARQQSLRQSRADTEDKRAKSLPRMRSAGNRTYMCDPKPYMSFGLYGRSDPQYPPIPGYTGYIPHMKSTDLGIGRTFSAAARKGLTQVARTRERQKAHLVS